MPARLEENGEFPNFLDLEDSWPRLLHDRIKTSVHLQLEDSKRDNLL